MTITANLNEVRRTIADCAKKYHRDPETIHLLLASKGQALAKMQEAYEAGQRLFGENYWQEALPKMAALKTFADIEWHFIGRIQRNKTKKIAEHFHWVQSLTEPYMAKRLHEQRPAHLPPLQICIEVNVSGEKSKSGISPSSVFALAEHCQTFSRLKLRGLMMIARETPDVAQQRAEFRALFLLKETINQKMGLQLDTLSMGMSGDFEAAIAEGATIVRIGRAILGERA